MEEQTVVQPLSLEQQLNALFSGTSSWSNEIGTAIGNAFDAGAGNWLLLLVAVLAAGLVGEKLLCLKLNALNRVIREQHAEKWTQIAGYALFRLVFDLAGVLLFVMFAWIALYFLADRNTPYYDTLGALIGSIMVFRLCVIVARAVLSPQSEGIRPLALSNADAQSVYHWVVLFIGCYAAINFIETVFVFTMATPVLQAVTTIVFGLGLMLVLVAFVWANRTRLMRLFSSDQPAAQSSTLGQLFSQSWPFLVTAWLMLLWVNWAYSIITQDVAREQSTSLSWWITLLFPAADRLVHALLTKVTRLEVLRNTGFDLRRERFISIVQTCVRAILVTAALIALAVTWNLAGANLLQSKAANAAIWRVVDISVLLLIAYILYEVVMSMLDKHIAHEGDTQEETEGEFGGPGATREQTLAPLLRGTFIVVMSVIVALTVLSALGVQILPLIAGAGIVGIAIGFGSQKLVMDIISGMFFLIDDAFRRGEYIDVGSVKGTVEKISIRSMQLRHHMGPLHTIPFGEIRHLTNFSRDWAMMKLKLRLTYDTDPEKVRKLIKKLGQEMLEEEEFKDKFLQPLKSQGVYSMEDDSAMIIRVKFMTRPGEQFTIRKTVYSRIRELFEREGIQFATRVVSVRLDGEGTDKLSEREKRTVAGAVLENPTATAEPKVAR